MRLDDFIYIGFIHIGVPNRFWIDHQDRPAFAAVHAPRLVDAHATRPVEAQGFDLGFAMLPSVLRLMIAAACVWRIALVQAKKYMVFEIAVVSHTQILGGLMARLVAEQISHSPGQERKRPSPTQPLGQAVEANEFTLFPSLHGLCKVGARGHQVQHHE